MNIRQALLERLKGSSVQELNQIIDEGIASKEETILPGLGVLFETYYQTLDPNAKTAFLSSIAKLLR